MFSARELKRRGASARIIQRIGRKQRGARSGSAGYRQEDFFAAGQMIAAAHRFVENGEHFWMIQNAAALVDDLVTGNGIHRFFQLKTSPHVAWATVLPDFRDQAELCRLFKLDSYQLVLIVPAKADRDRLAREQPPVLEGSSVQWFPKMSRTGDLAHPSSPVWRNLKALCAGRAGAGDIASIATYAFVTVLERPAKPKRYEVAAFVKKLRENDCVPIRSPFVDTSALWKRASGVLARIPGLEVSIADGFVAFDYRSGLESGRAARCGTAAYRRFLERIVRSSPKTFDDFERLL